MSKKELKIAKKKRAKRSRNEQEGAKKIERSKSSRGKKLPDKMSS